METLQTHLRVYGAAYLSNYWIEARLIIDWSHSIATTYVCQISVTEISWWLIVEMLRSSRCSWVSFFFWEVEIHLRLFAISGTMTTCVRGIEEGSGGDMRVLMHTTSTTTTDRRIDKKRTQHRQQRTELRTKEITRSSDYTRVLQHNRRRWTR